MLLTVESRSNCGRAAANLLLHCVNETCHLACWTSSQQHASYRRCRRCCHRHSACCMRPTSSLLHADPLTPSPITDLVEVQGVQQVCELPVLFLLVQHDVVLHQAVQRQLALIVHVDLCWLQTHRARQRGRQGRCRTRRKTSLGAHQKHSIHVCTAPKPDASQQAAYRRHRALAH